MEAANWAVFLNLNNGSPRYVDLYLLHGAAGDDRELRSTWAALEEAVRRGKIRHLGVSNLDTTQLAALLAFASVGPSVVQNKLDVYHQVGDHVGVRVRVQGWVKVRVRVRVRVRGWVKVRVRG